MYLSRSCCHRLGHASLYLPFDLSHRHSPATQGDRDPPRHRLLPRVRTLPPYLSGNNEDRIVRRRHLVNMGIPLSDLHPCSEDLDTATRIPWQATGLTTGRRSRVPTRR